MKKVLITSITRIVTSVFLLSAKKQRRRIHKGWRKIGIKSVILGGFLFWGLIFGCATRGVFTTETVITFQPSDENFLNPERGFCNLILIDSDLSRVRAQGFSLGFLHVDLRGYRDRSLDSNVLSPLNRIFSKARESGIKLILRFTYSFGEEHPLPCLDATKPQILDHISQFKEILQENVDVIAVIQAGFIGCHGEFHSSAHGLDNPTDRTDIIKAMLRDFPASRMIQVRTPRYKSDAVGGPLDRNNAFTTTDIARVGHYNDCFLASKDDAGTYFPPPIEYWKNFLAQDSLFTCVGGETCLVNPPRSDCPTALSELQMFHWD